MTPARGLEQFLADLGDRYAPFLPSSDWGLTSDVIDRVFVEGYVFSESTEKQFQTRAALSVFVGADPVVPRPAADFLTLRLADGSSSEFAALLPAVATT